MQNAHLRLGQLEYLRSTANIRTSIRLQVDRYMGDEAEGHRVRRKRQRLTSNGPIGTAPEQHPALLRAASAGGSSDRDLSFLRTDIVALLLS